MERGIGDNSEAVAGDWIALARSTATHWVVGFGKPVKPADPKRGAFSRGEAWIDLIMLARWKPGQENNKGRKVDLDAGQLQGGYDYLAMRWNWTVKQVRLFLSKLVGEAMIERKQPNLECAAKVSKPVKQRGNQIQVITLCNYRKYQVAQELLEIEEGQARGKRGASEGQHLNKETKKQEEEDSSLRSESPASPSADPVPADLALEDPGKILFDKAVPEIASKSGKTEKAIRALVGKWRKVVTDEELLKIARSAYRSADPISYIGKIVSDHRDAILRTVRRENGRLTVHNGFKVELIEILKGRDLDRALAKIDGKIGAHVIGTDLERRVRSLAMEMVDEEERRSKGGSNYSYSGNYTGELL